MIILWCILSFFFGVCFGIMIIALVSANRDD